MTSASSQLRNRSASVLGLMPSSDRCSSTKRRVPAARSRTMRGVHRSPMSEAVRAMGQPAEASCFMNSSTGQ